MFKTTSDVGDEALGARFSEELKHDHGHFEYELQGKKIATIFELSPKLKWYFFLAKEISPGYLRMFGFFKQQNHLELALSVSGTSLAPIEQKPRYIN